jgi:arylsulfatase A-like enzyme
MNHRLDNVVLITCDCLRADFVGCCSEGNGTSLTPNLDRLAKNGITFKKAISQGFSTGISMPSIFTGKYPGRFAPSTITGTGMTLRSRNQSVSHITVDQKTTITEILAKHEYQTAGIHSNPFLTSFSGFDKGFQFFHDDLFLKNMKLPSGIKRYVCRLPRLLRASSHLPASKMSKKALGWLRKKEQPFFLWLHSMDTHGPYVAKGGFRHLNKIKGEILYHKASRHPEGITHEECETLRGWYKEEVAYLDEHLGRLFEGLEKMGLMERTLVIVTADHGDEFREHGGFGHRSTFYDELMRVPLIFKLPDSRHRGKIITKPVGLVQIVPTVLDILGIRTNETFDGKSLLPLIEKNDERALHEYIVSEVNPASGYKGCIRNEEWKLVTYTQRQELYHLATDPRELSNVFEDNPHIVAELETKHRQHRSMIDANTDVSELVNEDVDEEVLDRLKSLGYL